jgi:ring-1,2-phenylacetyl-CoA epoxidase subunit PaaE
MAKFYTLTIADIYKETKDSSVITFDVPDDLKPIFRYKQGQHLTLRAKIDGEDLRRSYSLCSAPHEGKWQVAVKRISNGIFSGYINDTLQKGDKLDVMPPHGNFYLECQPKQDRNYIAFAAGSGITPILSIIKTHLKEEPNCTFKLFYLNKSVKTIIFKEEIELLKNKYFGRFEIFHFLSKEKRNIPLFNGRFDKEKLKIITTKLMDIAKVDACFVCGPEEIIHLVKDELTAAGLEANKVHFELFTPSSGVRAKSAKVIENKVEGTDVTIIEGGKEFHFTMAEDDDNILDGALSAGADLPFACKGGVCSTCKCRVVEGTAEMKVNYALEESEVEKNFILSCQAVPTSKKLVVDFDV